MPIGNSIIRFSPVLIKPVDPSSHWLFLTLLVMGMGLIFCETTLVDKVIQKMLRT